MAVIPESARSSIRTPQSRDLFLGGESNLKVGSPWLGIEVQRSIVFLEDALRDVET